MMLRMDRWIEKPFDDERFASLKNTGLVHPITARLLASRGLTDESDLQRFFDPNLSRLRKPEGLAGFAEAIELLASAIAKGTKVGIFGDYDMDGVTSAAVLCEGLTNGAGAEVVARVAHRDRGYGFTKADAYFFESVGCGLVIMADCGTSDIESVQVLADEGIATIIVDHHTVPDAASSHPATVLLNPLLAHSEFPNKTLASVGLAFYVVCGLRTKLRELESWNENFDVRNLLDLVAIGTIGDMVPLINENRILVTVGLRKLVRRDRPGIAALLEQVGVKEDARISESTVGWRIGPYLNAPGRLGDAAPALELLLASKDEASACAEVLVAINEKRKEESGKVLERVKEQEETMGSKPIVVAHEEWHPGVVGIAASRLKEKHSQPAFVIAANTEGDEARGSARAPNGVHLVEWLASCDDILERFGGHAAAAGFSIKNDRIEEFTKRIEQMVAPVVEKGAPEVDCKVKIGDVDAQLAGELTKFLPYGKGNDRIRLGCDGLEIIQSKVVGEGKHLKLRVRDDGGNEIAAIAFGKGDREVGPGTKIDAVVVPRLNTWNGVSNVEFQIIDFEEQT